MGFAGELRRVEDRAADWDPAFLSAVGAWGAHGDVRRQVERLGEGLDLPIVRVLVAHRGDAASARGVLEDRDPLGCVPELGRRFQRRRRVRGPGDALELAALAGSGWEKPEDRPRGA